MPSFAEIMMQQAGESSQKVGSGLAQSFATGAELAMKAEQVRQQRAQIEQQKQQLEQAKLAKFAEAVEKGQQYAGKAQSNYYNKFLPSYRDSLGLTQHFSDETLQFMTASPENLARFNTIVADVRAGHLNERDAIALLNDPVKFADIQMSPDKYKLLSEAANIALQDKLELKKQKNQFTQQTNEEAVRRATAGRVKADEKIGSDYAKFTTGGGLAGVQAKLAKLREVQSDLESGKLETGSFGDTAASIIGGEGGVALVNKKLKAAQDKVRSAVNLKGSLDSAFSKAEAEQAFGRAFDVKLTTEQNKEKVAAMIAELEGDITTALSEFKKINPDIQTTVAKRGAPPPRTEAPDNAGQLPAPALDPAVQNKLDLDFIGRGKTPAEKDARLANLARRKGIPVNQLKKQLGVK